MEMLWVAGKQSLIDGQLAFTSTMAGKLDWGRSAYAAAGKILPASSQTSQKSSSPDRFISYLWLTGNYYETLDFPTNQQNWTSSLLLPRELSIGYLDVVDNSLAREQGSWRVESKGNGTVRLAFLRQNIAREPLAAFKSNATTVIAQPRVLLSSTTAFSTSPHSKHYLLSASITFLSSA